MLLSLSRHIVGDVVHCCNCVFYRSVRTYRDGITQPVPVDRSILLFDEGQPNQPEFQKGNSTEILHMILTFLAALHLINSLNYSQLMKDMN